jgi:hypothetical protein
MSKGRMYAMIDIRKSLRMSLISETVSILQRSVVAAMKVAAMKVAALNRSRHANAFLGLHGSNAKAEIEFVGIIFNANASPSKTRPSILFQLFIMFENILSLLAILLGIVSAQQPSNNGRCGANFGLTCAGAPYGQCCSSAGWW